MAWLDGFLADAGRRGLSPRTLARYRDALKKVMVDYGLDLETCTQDRLIGAFDDLRRKHKPSYVMLHITLAKMALRYLKRKELAETLVYPKLPDVEEKIATKVLKPEDRAKLIREAPSLQDRLIIGLLDETGGRKGELYKLRIRDVQFENIGERQTAILQLSGKTGTRRRRVYECVPDLRSQINNHPHKDNPDATLLLAKNGNTYTIDMFYHTVRELGKHILKRPIHPHMFRHTAATNDSRLFTDRELMKLYGWKTPTMVGIYSHISMRDVDDKDLVLHGLKKKEEILQPIMQIRRCPKCNYENAPIAIYCGECGFVMGQQSENITSDDILKIFREHPEILYEAVRKDLKEYPLGTRLQSKTDKTTSET